MCNYLTDPLGCVAGAAANGVIGDIANAVQTAEADMIGSLSTLWVGVPTPVIGSTQTGQPVGAVLFLWDATSWYVGVFAVLGLLIAAGRTAWTRKSEPLQDALKGLINLVLVTGCVVAGVELAIQAGDGFSNWILNQALGQQAGSGQFTSTGASQFDTAVKNIANLSAQGSAQMLVIVLGLLAILAAIVQIVLMIVRYAMLGLLAGMLPITASVSGMQAGKTVFRKNGGWLIAFVIYKPTAALIYAYSIVEMKQDSLVSEVAGIAMIVMACVALPALMRFVSPMVSGVSGGGGGAGAALAGAGVAAGARMVSSNSGSGGGGGGGAEPGPSGAQSAASSGASAQQSSGSGPSGADSGGGGGGESSGGASGAESAGGGSAGAGQAAGAGQGAAGGGAAAAGGGGSAAAGAAAATGPVGVAAGAALAAGSAAKQGIEKAAGGATGEQ